MSVVHIGFDDTDSPRGGCTTYIAALLVEKLEKIGAKFIDYPKLIRLNPNVPWKTRGNGALCLEVKCNNAILEEVFEVVVETVERNSEISCEGTDPGIVFFQGAEIPEAVRTFAKKTIKGIVKLEQALKLLKRFRAEALGFGSGQGIIGALAAVGEGFEGDYTYEVIAYRSPENRGRKRRLDFKSVEEMDRKMKAATFNNIDPEKGRFLITPRGPDPILYGIRGESAEAVVNAREMIHSHELIERWVVFRTNQGTDAHLKDFGSISEVQPYHPVVVRGVVASSPRIVPRRHRIFTIEDETGRIDCAAYEPTGTLRKVAGHLITGDLLEVSGGVRPPSTKNPVTINLEKIRILKLADKLISHNPNCTVCSKKMKSMGTRKGFRCPKCGFRSQIMRRTVCRDDRKITNGLYITSHRSQRHLTKPMNRYGREKSSHSTSMIAHWHDP